MAGLLLWVFFSGAVSQNIPSLNLNAICNDEPETWRCERLSPNLKEAIKSDQKYVYGNEDSEPILCFPLTQPKPSEAPTVTKLIPQTQATTSQPSFWSISNITEIPEEKPQLGSSWTTTPNTYEIEPTTIKTLSHKSKADRMCEVYSQYVFRIEESPALIGNQDTIKINECGMQRFVVGGAEAKPREFPHMAQIGFDGRPNIEWLCGGSLISPKFVLSAAHCASQPKRVANWVRLGDLDISIDNDDAEPVEVRILKIIKHPEYRKRFLYHDIALYELESDIKLGPYIRPVCLQSTKDINSNTALASGWGKSTMGGVSSKRLLKVNVTLVKHEKCSMSYDGEVFNLPNGIIDDLLICAGGKEGDTCQGDSGGPLIIPHKDVYCMYSQIGVISFGKGCGLYPGVYTRVSNYLPWIESVVWP